MVEVVEGFIFNDDNSSVLDVTNVCLTVNFFGKERQRYPGPMDGT